MNYVLPRSIRENLIRKSVYDFETQYLLISAIEKRIATEIVETIPLWESLFSIGFKNEKITIYYFYDFTFAFFGFCWCMSNAQIRSWR